MRLLLLDQRANNSCLIVFLSWCPFGLLSAIIKYLAAMCVLPLALKGDPVAPIFLIHCSYKWCHLASADYWLFQYQVWSLWV